MSASGIPRSSKNAALALLAAGDLGALQRKAVQKLQGRPLLLPPLLRGAPRPARRREAAPRRDKPLLWMISPSLALDGAPLSQLELALGFSSAGLRVDVLSPFDGRLRDRYQAAGIKVSVCPELVCSPAVPEWYEKDVRFLAAMLDREQPDALFVSTIDNFAAVDAAALAGIPVIWSIRESEHWRERLADRHPAIAARALASLSYCEALIFVAESSRARWSDFVPAGRSHLIHNAAHPSIAGGVLSPDERRSIRAELGAGADDLLVVSIGTLCPRKNQVDLAKALRLLPSRLLSKFRAAFIGRADRGYADEVKGALAAAPAAQVQFIGETVDGPKYAAAADVLVNTSRSEAFPRTFIEAAAGRTAVVAANIDGAPERLQDGVSALLYEPGDLADLAAKLEAVTDPSFRSKLADGAHARLIRDWTYGEMVDAYMHHVSSALTRGSAHLSV